MVWEYEADGRHADTIVFDQGLEQSKSTAVTGTAEPGEYVQEEPLSDALASECRTLGGTAMYLSEDRPDIAYAAKEVMRDASCPTEFTQRKLKKLGRYLRGCPRLVWKYGWSDRDGVVETSADSDHAGCKRTRRSTSGGAVMMDGHLIRMWSITQPLVSLSSGESEFYAAVKAVVEILYLRSFLEGMRKKCVYKLFSDSSAARGMLTRVGSSPRAKHININYLFVQQHVKNGDIIVKPVAGERNVAALATKYVTAETRIRLLRLLGLVLMPEVSVSMTVDQSTVQEESSGSSIMIVSCIVIAMLFGYLCFSIGWLCRWRSEEEPQRSSTAGKKLEQHAPSSRTIYLTKDGAKNRIYHTDSECDSLRIAHRVEVLRVCKVCLRSRLT